MTVYLKINTDNPEDYKNAKRFIKYLRRFVPKDQKETKEPDEVSVQTNG